MTNMLAARQSLVSDLRRELVGPDPLGKEVDCAAQLAFDTFEAAAGPYRQASSGEEILTGDRPLKRYGIGVLYPIGLKIEDEPETSETEEQLLEELSEEQAAQDEAGAVSRAGSGEDPGAVPSSRTRSRSASRRNRWRTGR